MASEKMEALVKIFHSNLLARSGKKKRMKLDEILLAFRDTLPGELDTSVDAAFKQLRYFIDALSSRNTISVPKDKHGWNHSQDPALPSWILLHAEEIPKRIQWWKEYPWRPEWHKICTITHVSDDQLQNAIAVNEFFKDVACGKISEEFIPVKERSWLLFGDEKRLEPFLETNLCKECHITMDALRCFIANEPIPHVKFQSRRPNSAIIIENKDTFASIARVCERLEPSAPYQYVIYGRGFGLTSNAQSIPQLNPNIGIIEYFGDIDPPGLKIPLDIQNKLKITHCSQDIVPNVELYTRAFDLYEAGNKTATIKAIRAAKWDETILAFLPLPLQGKARDLFEKGNRIPQEIVNYHELSLIFS